MLEHIARRTIVLFKPTRALILFHDFKRYIDDYTTGAGDAERVERAARACASEYGVPFSRMMRRASIIGLRATPGLW